MKPRILWRFPKPDDFHVHLRDGAVLKDTVSYTASRYYRAVVMPNLKPPVISVKQARDYRERILSCVSSEDDFFPLMTLYLHAELRKEEIKEIAEHPWLLGIKLYPAMATTNSEEGIGNIEAFYGYFELMEKYRVPLLIHAEVPDSSIDYFEREKVFIDRHLLKLRETFPELKITFEHVSTKEGVEFVKAYPNTAATVTPQHILLTRNDLFEGGLRPHHFCLPVVKTRADKEAILEEIIAGNPKFFAGTDSAPHPRRKKETSVVAAGVFTSPVSVELYCYAIYSYAREKKGIENPGEIQKLLQDFLCRFGAGYYGYPGYEGKQQVVVVEEELEIPQTYRFGEEEVVPLRAGEKLPFRSYLDYGNNP